MKGKPTQKTGLITRRNKMSSNTQALVDVWSTAKAKSKAAAAEVVLAQNEMIAVIGVGEFPDLGVSVVQVAANEGRKLTEEDIGRVVGARKMHYRASLIHKNEGGV